MLPKVTFNIYSRNLHNGHPTEVATLLIQTLINLKVGTPHKHRFISVHIIFPFWEVKRYLQLWILSFHFSPNFFMYIHFHESLFQQNGHLAMLTLYIHTLSVISSPLFIMKSVSLKSSIKISLRHKARRNDEHRKLSVGISLCRCKSDAPRQLMNVHFYGQGWGTTIGRRFIDWKIYLMEIQYNKVHYTTMCGYIHRKRVENRHVIIWYSYQAWNTALCASEYGQNQGKKLHRGIKTEHNFDRILMGLLNITHVWWILVLLGSKHSWNPNSPPTCDIE